MDEEQQVSELKGRIPCLIERGISPTAPRYTRSRRVVKLRRGIPRWRRQPRVFLLCHPGRVAGARRRCGDPLPVRPDRSEPRAVKRRPKNFQLLTKPRAQMVVERSRKQSQKPSNNALN